MKTQNCTYHLFGKFHWVGAAVCVLGLLITTGTSALAQSSGQTRPFHAEVENIRLPSENPGAWEYVSYGNATHLGKITGGGDNMVTYWLDFPILYGKAVDTMVAANGDKLYSVYTWWLNYFEDVVYATWEIDGGTGRFADATGEGTAVGHNNEAGNRVFILDGVINY